jgi:hypothetical protein
MSKRRTHSPEFKAKCPVSIRLTGGVNLVDRSGLLF